MIEAELNVRVRDSDSVRERLAAAEEVSLYWDTYHDRPLAQADLRVRTIERGETRRCIPTWPAHSHCPRSSSGVPLAAGLGMPGAKANAMRLGTVVK